MPPLGALLSHLQSAVEWWILYSEPGYSFITQSFDPACGGTLINKGVTYLEVQLLFISEKLLIQCLQIIITVFQIFQIIVTLYKTKSHIVIPTAY